MDTIEADIQKRLQKLVGRNNLLPGETAIHHDLSIAGDDAFELLSGIFGSYGTSTEGFYFSEFFPNETEALWLHVKSKLGFPDRNRRRLTVAHLIAVVKKGAWFAPLPAVQNS